MTRTGSVPPPDFDAKYRADADPWQVTTSAYEQRKNAVVLASLPDARYRTAWEPGCGIGALTRGLAERCDRVVASDGSVVAVGLATQRCADLAHVRIRHSTLPDTPLTGPVDLLVASEFLYYLPDLAAGLATLWAQVRPGGQIAAVHWRYAGEDTCCSGEQLHQELARYAAARDAPRLVHHLDEHFILDIYRRT